MSGPRVAVIIPVYNREDLIAEAITSALMEPDVDVEVVVVDDGSADRSAEVVHLLAAAEPRVRLVLQTNQGQSAARNAGVAVAVAPLVTFLDSDDLMVRGRLRKQVEAWTAHAGPRCVVIGHDRVEVLEGVEPPEHIKHRAANGLTVYHACALLHRDDFDRIGGFDVLMRFAEDLDFVKRLEDSGCPVVTLDDVLVVRRIRGDNLVYDPAMARAMFAMLRRRASRARAAGGASESRGLSKSR